MALNTENEIFLDFYENALNLMAEDLSENFKNLCEQFLKYNMVIKDSSATNESSDFKLFLEQYLRDYPHLKRYRNFEPLLSLILNTANLDYHNEFEKDHETDMKFKKIFKQYFTAILQDYEENYKKFIKEKLLPIIEDPYGNLIPENKRQSPEYKKLIENLKTCQEFSCFPKSPDFLMPVLNMTKDLVMKNTIKDYTRFLNIILIGTYNRSHLILKDELIFQLSQEIRKNLTLDIQEFMEIFEYNSNTIEFLSKVKENLNLPKKYYKNTNFSANDQKILNEIFEKYTTHWVESTKYGNGMRAAIQILSIKMVLFLVLAPNAIPKDYTFLLEYKAF